MFATGPTTTVHKTHNDNRHIVKETIGGIGLSVHSEATRAFPPLRFLSGRLSGEIAGQSIHQAPKSRRLLLSFP